MRKEHGKNNRLIFVLLCASFLVCFALLSMALQSCSTPYSKEVEILSDWAQPSIESYVITSFEKYADEEGHTFYYIAADFDDEYGKGTTSGIFYCDGTKNTVFIHSSDFDGPKKSIVDKFKEMKAIHAGKVYSDEEISEIVSLIQN